MLQRTFQMRYYLRAGTDFRNMETMQTFLQELAALGYHVVALSEYEKIYREGRNYVWPATDNDENLPDDAPADASTPAGYLPQGVSLLAQGEAAKFAANKDRHLWLAAFPVAQHELTSSFSSGLSFPAQFNTASIMITLATIGFAARTGDALQVFERWLELFKLMWHTWQPLYAHSYAPHTAWPEPDEEDVQAARLLYLYEINLFSPELVEQLGKTRILQTPAWKVQSLDEGSILLIPEFIFVPRGPEEKQGDLAAQHLGLRQFLRGRYLPTPVPQDG